MDLDLGLCGKFENMTRQKMKNYLPQRHKDRDKKCTSLLTSILFYERQYMVSVRQKLREMHIKIQQGKKETTLGNVPLLHFWR